jgi:hypothetical protein
MCIWDGTSEGLLRSITIGDRKCRTANQPWYTSVGFGCGECAVCECRLLSDGQDCEPISASWWCWQYNGVGFIPGVIESIATLFLPFVVSVDALLRACACETLYCRGVSKILDLSANEFPFLVIYFAYPISASRLVLATPRVV